MVVFFITIGPITTASHGTQVNSRPSRLQVFGQVHTLYLEYSEVNRFMIFLFQSRSAFEQIRLSKHGLCRINSVHNLL